MRVATQAPSFRSHSAWGLRVFHVSCTSTSVLAYCSNVTDPIAASLAGRTGIEYGGRRTLPKATNRDVCETHCAYSIPHTSWPLCESTQDRAIIRLFCLIPGGPAGLSRRVTIVDQLGDPAGALAAARGFLHVVDADTALAIARVVLVPLPFYGPPCS